MATHKPNLCRRVSNFATPGGAASAGSLDSSAAGPGAVRSDSFSVLANSARAMHFAADSQSGQKRAKVSMSARSLP
jgi:hypothetical protein